MSDKQRVFHPIGLVLSRDETSADFQFIFTSLKIGLSRCEFDQLGSVDLIADAADAITNGFEKSLVSDGQEYKRGNWLMKSK